MNEIQQHAPPPGGGGVYWAVNVNWKHAALLGLFLLSITLLALTPFFIVLHKDQIRSFTAATTVLEGHGILGDLQQRQAVLSRENGVFFWRAIVWERDKDRVLPRLFYAKVDKKQGFRVIESGVIPYDRETALRLNLYDEVDEQE